MWLSPGGTINLENREPIICSPTLHFAVKGELGAVELTFITGFGKNNEGCYYPLINHIMIHSVKETEKYNMLTEGCAYSPNTLCYETYLKTNQFNADDIKHNVIHAPDKLFYILEDLYLKELNND